MVSVCLKISVALDETPVRFDLERDRDQVGSGLGLSLVAAVMRLHRATIELLDNRPGLLVRCVLPVRNQLALNRA